MGETVYHCLKASSLFTCSGIKVRTKKTHKNHEASLLITEDLDAVVRACDILIDFSMPSALEEHLEMAEKYRKPFVLCVTGLSHPQQARVSEAAHTLPICLASNTSLAIAVLGACVERAVSLLGDTYDIEIFEAHHRNKIDAPSGTALMLGETAAKARGAALSDLKTYPHLNKRRKGSIGFSVARGGGITSEHTVYLYGDDDVMSFSHKSLNKSLYAKGAIKLAQLLHKKTPGLYTPQELFLT